MEKINQIKIEYSERIPLKRNSHYQNDFFITIGNSSSRVTILSNQPLYPNTEKTGFEIADKEFAEIMGYSKLDIKEVIFHDLRDCGEFSSELSLLVKKISLNF